MRKILPTYSWTHGCFRWSFYWQCRVFVKPKLTSLTVSTNIPCLLLLTVHFSFYIALDKEGCKHIPQFVLGKENFLFCTSSSANGVLSLILRGKRGKLMTQLISDKYDHGPWAGQREDWCICLRQGRFWCYPPKFLKTKTQRYPSLRIWWSISTDLLDNVSGCALPRSISTVQFVGARHKRLD